MSMDTMILNWSRTACRFLQIAGHQHLWAAQAMQWHPFWAPLAGPVGNYGRFLLQKGRPVRDPAWSTANRIVYEGHKVALRKFNPGKKGNPLLIVPPEAGHNSLIVDYGPRQSLVQCALAHHDGDVYVVDKLPARAEHTGYSLDDCIRSLKVCAEKIGEPVHLVGLCQGGWQAAVFTALFPLEVQSLVLAAAPIDFHAGDGQIAQWAAEIPMDFYETLVRMGGGNMPGYFIVFGFMMLNPVERFVGDDIKLFNHADDPRFTERYDRFNNWYNRTQPLPGKMYLQIVKELFKENKLVKNDLYVLGRRVELRRISHPLTLVAGAKDDITPPPQLFAMSRHAGSENTAEVTVSAGHIGVFMAKDVIARHWSRIFAGMKPQPRIRIDELEDEVAMNSR